MWRASSLKRSVGESTQRQVNMPIKQSPSSIIMLRPQNFGFDEETAESNRFQSRSSLDQDEVKKKARAEFDQAVRDITAAGVTVEVFEDRMSPVCPDAVFPNNWFSTHKEGLVIIYAMEAEARRREIRKDIIDHLVAQAKRIEILDLSHRASAEGRYLEGTGSIVFDYTHAKAYACRSSRTNKALLDQVCQALKYESVVFDACDAQGSLIYHTNVMMWIGTKMAAVCLESIRDEQERGLVNESLRQSGRQILTLSLDEIQSFCGNCYEVMDKDEKEVLIMSKSARRGLTESNWHLLERSYSKIVVCEIDTIETEGGGSIRCMMAGNFLR